MLPVLKEREETGRQIAVYAVITAVVTLALGLFIP